MKSYKMITINGRRIKNSRYVMEKSLGRSLLITEIVHHKDGDNLNDNINNLVIMSSEEHTSLHHAGKRKQRAAEFLECLGNGKPIHQCEEENNRIDEEVE